MPGATVLRVTGCSKGMGFFSKPASWVSAYWRMCVSQTERNETIAQENLLKGGREMEKTLKSFIERMSDGWGFYRPSRVREIGFSLWMQFRDDTEAMATPVEVKYVSTSTGSGSSFHYQYIWIVKGVPLSVRPDGSSIWSVGSDGFTVGYSQ